MSIPSLKELIRAIERLSDVERAEIWEALRQFERAGYRVAEPRTAYGATSRRKFVPVEDYLEGELRSEVRHEYVAGQVYAMSGATDSHNRIAGNLFSDLHVHLRGKRCEPFMNDMKVHLESQGDEWFYYPDVMVNCDPQGQEKLYCNTPAVIVEVLSPSTERTDRQEKRLAYETITSLHTYVLVAQDCREVTMYRRAGDGWARKILPRDGQRLHIAQLDFSIDLDSLYARTGL